MQRWAMLGQTSYRRPAVRRNDDTSCNRPLFPPLVSPDKPPPMPYEVAAFYQFAALLDFRELRQPLRAMCADLRLKGSVLLAHEGINGTLAGGAEAIAAVVEELRQGTLFGGRLDNLELKFSHASAMPFQRLKIRDPRRHRHRSCTAGRH